MALLVTAFSELVFFGGNRTDVSVVFALVQCVLLGVVLSTPSGSMDLQQLTGWPVASVIFGLLTAVILASLAPTPLGGSVIWTQVNQFRRVAVSPINVLVELSKLFGYASAFTVAAIIARERRRAAVLMNGVVLMSFLFALFCLITEAISPTEVLGWAKPGIAQNRVSGLFSSANTAATVFGIGALLSLGGILREVHRSNQTSLLRISMAVIQFSPLKLASAILCVGCLLLTASRGGAFAFAVAVVSLLSWSSWGSKKRLTTISLLLLVIIGLLALSGGVLWQRVANVSVFNDARPQWAVAVWSLIKSSPVAGYGLGSLPTLFLYRFNAANVQSLYWAGSAHDVYLQWLAQAGVLGAVPMWALVAWILWVTGFKSVGRGSANIWRKSLLTCSLLVLVDSVFEYSLEEPAIAALWSILLGVGFSIGAEQRLQPLRAPSPQSPAVGP